VFSILQTDLLVFRIDPPLPEVFRPGHLMPIAHQPSRVLRPNVDPNVTGDLLGSDSDDRTTLARL